MTRVDESHVRDAYRVMAPHLYGPLGTFAYQAFDFINDQYFAGQVPETLIIWDLTAHGSALGWCRSSKHGPPIIKIHPSVVEPSLYTDKYRIHFDRCFNIPTRWLGLCYAFDVLLHEMMHAHINYNLGGTFGCDTAGNGITPPIAQWDSHNNPNWVNECNRIAKLLDIPCEAQMKRKKRIGRTVRWVNEGNCDISHYPHEFRIDFYKRGVLPAMDGNGKP